MAKLIQRPGSYIQCRQCQVVLYKGQPQRMGPAHARQSWIPQPHGSRTPPKIPPKRCPFCEGTTGQVGMLDA